MPCVKTLPFNVVEDGYKLALSLMNKANRFDQAQRAEAWFSMYCVRVYPVMPLGVVILENIATQGQ